MRHIHVRLFGSIPMADVCVTKKVEFYGAHDTPSVQCIPEQALDGRDEAIGDSTKN
jgi:hypothetical protein